jgi:hypothetical protein
MADEIRIKNLDEVVSSLVASGDRAEVAGAYALGQVALTIERQAKLNAATGTHPRGFPHIPGTGPGPNRVTGNLQRSIKTELRKGFGVYSAQVGPGMIYGRAVEMGSPRWKSGVSYPYLYPAAESVAPRASIIFTQAFKRRFRRG